MSTLKNALLGYLGNPSVKKDGVQSQFTKEEVLEYSRCMKDPCYFAQKYVKVISLDSGLVPFTLYPYQLQHQVVLSGVYLLIFYS